MKISAKTVERPPSTPGEASPIRCFVSSTTGSRKWSISFKWLGWHRVLSFGIILNVRNFVAAVFLLGWEVEFGRRIDRQTESIDIPRREVNR